MALDRCFTSPVQEGASSRSCYIGLLKVWGYVLLSWNRVFPKWVLIYKILKFIVRFKLEWHERRQERKNQKNQIWGGDKAIIWIDFDGNNHNYSYFVIQAGRDSFWQLCSVITASIIRLTRPTFFMAYHLSITHRIIYRYDK